MKFRDHGFDWIVWALFLGLPPLVMHQAATSLAEQGVASGGPLENAAVFPRIVAWVLAGLCVIHALRLIAVSFFLLAGYILVESIRDLTTGTGPW